MYSMSDVKMAVLIPVRSRSGSRRGIWWSGSGSWCGILRSRSWLRISRRRGRRIRLRLLLGILSLSFVGNFSHETIVAIDSVGHLLSSAIRKVNIVFSWSQLVFPVLFVAVVVFAVVVDHFPFESIRCGFLGVRGLIGSWGRGRGWGRVSRILSRFRSWSRGIASGFRCGRRGCRWRVSSGFWGWGGRWGRVFLWGWWWSRAGFWLGILLGFRCWCWLTVSSSSVSRGEEWGLVKDEFPLREGWRNSQKDGKGEEDL